MTKTKRSIKKTRHEKHAPLLDTLTHIYPHFSRRELESLIRLGKVRIKDQIIDKPGTLVPIDSCITLTPLREYVSRGALKLLEALSKFQLSPTDKICADIGASTGGFTQILLQHGAAKVYAIDVGYGELAWSLRTDSRVIVMERTNARYLKKLPEDLELVTIDLSFISLTKILPNLKYILKAEGHFIALVKPQFEAKRSEVGAGGIITDVSIHQKVIDQIVNFLPQVGLQFHSIIPSPILGAEGNKEFLLWGAVL